MVSREIRSTFNKAANAAAAALCVSVSLWWICSAAAVEPRVPTTQPIGDLVYFRSLESAGTLVLVQRRENPTYDVMSGRWWQSGWHDTFVWRPGYSWAAVYGWEARYLTADGRWVILHKHGEYPRTVAVLPLLERYRLVMPYQSDFDHDGDVDQSDFGVIQAALGRVGPSVADLNGDGIVDDADVDLWYREKPASVGQ